MIIADKNYELNIDEVAAEVERLLVDNRLMDHFHSADNRVSALPDLRTIRYYSGLGLVDRPKVVGRVAKYQRRHLLQLLAIKILQGVGLPLSEIQPRLYGLSDDELQNLIAMYLSDAARDAAKGQTQDTVKQAVKDTSGALSKTVNRRRQLDGGVRSVRLQEVVIEPGFKILAEQSWVDQLIKDSKGKVDLQLLHQKITEALEILISTSPDQDLSGDIV
jgi:DNA-binding transcriptional MerR regulator